MSRIARICSVEECGLKHRGNGWCNMHYQSWKRHGDPLASPRTPRHGLSKTPEYGIWMGIKKRCCNKNYREYYLYGGRGIKVCDRWLNSFSNFLEDMGQRPKGDYSIDRIDNNGDYEPGNCKWSTRVEQANNTRQNLIISYRGQSRTLAQWCRKLDLSYRLMEDRIIKLKWSPAEAFSTPLLK